MFHAYVPSHGAGAEGMAHALLRHLVQCGHDVDVILSQVDADVPGDYAFDGVHVHAHRGKTQTPNWLASPHRPDVIVTHLENTSRAAVLGKMFGIPVVQLLHNHRPETQASTVHHWFGLLVANSEWMAQDFMRFWAERQMSGPPAPMIRVRPPVDPTEYATKPGSHVTLVNLTVPKGAHVFYGLAERLPQFTFLGVKGAYGIQVVRDDLPNVKILDHVESHRMVRTVYARTKVVLMPSDYESYGRVAAEAICSGIPVIAHPTDGLRECLGDAGIFHDRDDLDAWAAELRRLHTPRGYAVSSKAAKDRAAQLDPTDDLETWRAAIEEVARVSTPARHRR
jgi:glycosyltransferase involved in cell wall biosynthesis